MFLVSHPEVLADDWLPPVALGREAEVRAVVARLDVPVPALPPPWIVAVAGPSGSGTSTVARRAAREASDRLREAGHEGARVLRVRVARQRGTHGVASSLLRLLDDGFEGRGFPVAEILAGVLRRVRRLGRPTLVVLDDIGLAGPDLAPVVRALAEPDRFLPEGESGLPPLWTILAGTTEGLHGSLAGVTGRYSVSPFVELAAYDPRVLRTIARDRALRSLGRDPPARLVELVVARSVADGGGARRAFDVLRRELLGVGPEAAGRFDLRAGVPVEPHVVEAIGQASRGPLARLAEVRRWEAKFARQAGRAPLPTTTLWRRIVRLEQAGYLRREIRTGGPGGTLSVLRLLTPTEEWVTAARTGTRPVAGASPSWVPSADWGAETEKTASGPVTFP